jgi:hypothetical protein
VARRLKVARVTVDFSDVQEFEALEKGEYPVLIEKAEYREPQTDDKYPYINLELTVIEGEAKGRKLWMILSFSPKALWRMKDVFENLGLYEDEVEVDYDEETMLVTEPELAGLPALAVVSQRTYEGRTQNQVDALLSPDDKPGKKEPGAKKPTAAKKPAAKSEKKTTRKFQ